MKPLHLSCLVTALFVAAPVPAQDFSSVGDAGVSFGAATVNQAVLSSTTNPGLRNRGARLRPRRSPARTFGGFLQAQPIASPATSYSYQVTPALAQQAVSGYISRASRTEPRGAKEFAAQLARHNYRQVYRSLLSGSGLRENDAADAVAAYTALGWMIANNQLSDPDPRALRAVRSQIAARVAGNAAFSPAQRGRLGEEMKLLFVTLHAGWQGAQREGNLRRYSDGVANMFSRNGIDLRALRMTAQGFVAR